MNKALWVVVLAGVVTAPFTPAAAQQPPAGRIVFQRYAGDLTTALYVSDAAGVQPLLSGATAGPNDMNPAWSPDGSSVVFTSDRDGQRSLYVAAADGSAVRRLTTPPAGGDAYDPIYDDHATWSPDGTQIVFQSNREDGTGFGYDNIWVVASDGSSEPRLVVPVAADLADERAPAWSPDGQWIAFAADSAAPHCYAVPTPEECTTYSYGALNSEIWITTPDGSAQHLFANEDSDEFQPAWSPDGGQLAYLSQVGPFPDLFVRDLASDTERQVTATVDRSESAPVWSPDGSSIAFSFPNEEQRQGRNIYSVPPSGSFATAEAFLNHSSGAAPDDYGYWPDDDAPDWVGAVAAAFEVPRTRAVAFEAAQVETAAQLPKVAPAWSDPAGDRGRPWALGTTVLAGAVLLTVPVVMWWRGRRRPS